MVKRKIIVNLNMQRKMKKKNISMKRKLKMMRKKKRIMRNKMMKIKWISKRIKSQNLL